MGEARPKARARDWQRDLGLKQEHGGQVTEGSGHEIITLQALGEEMPHLQLSSIAATCHAARHAVKWRPVCTGAAGRVRKLLE